MFTSGCVKAEAERNDWEQPLRCGGENVKKLLTVLKVCFKINHNR